MEDEKKTGRTRRRIIQEMKKHGGEINQSEFNRILEMVAPASKEGISKAIEFARFKGEPIPTSSLTSTEALTDEQKISIADPSTGQIPLLYSGWTATPNTFVRSAVFAAVPDKKRPEYHQEWRELVCWENECSISLKGEELSQSDHTLFLVLVRMYADQGLSLEDELIVPTYAILKALQVKSVQKYYYEKIKRQIERMVSTTLQVKAYWMVYTGSLLYSAKLDDRQKGKWVIRINPELANLFQSNHFTYVQLEDHLKIKTALGSWLSLFIQSHDFPKVKMRVERLFLLSGSKFKHLSTFKRQLKAAFKELEEHQILSYWKIEGSVVEFSRAPKKAKRRLSK